MRRVVSIILSLCLLVAWLPSSHAAEGKTDKKKTNVANAKKKSHKGKPAKKSISVKPKPAKIKEIPSKKDTLAALTSLPESAVPLAVVNEMRYWSNPDYTRIAVTLDREAKYEYHHLPANPATQTPARLYVDINGAKLAPGVKDIPIGDGLLKTARVAQYRPDTARVVLDLDSIKDYKIFAFSDPFRILIDVKGERKTEISRPRETVLEAAPGPITAKMEPVEEKNPGVQKKAIGKIRRVVVDPGHGGHDPGALGAGGTKEKDIVLQVGLRLAKKLKEELGLDIVMTRSTDVFLELQERTAIANQVGADLFVSIHANASPNRNTTGIETYYLNLAKTEKAAQLAAKENGTSLEKVSLLQAVLFDLMANYKINDSAHLAEEVQKSLHRRVSSRYQAVKSLGVKQGPFYVLVGATMPSILVETAFLSNEKDEERLKDPQYQEATADGIVDGVRGYINSLK